MTLCPHQVEELLVVPVVMHLLIQVALVSLAHFGGGDFGLAEPETNFWGVYVHTLPADGNTYILGIGLNNGLWIFDNP